MALGIFAFAIIPIIGMMGTGLKVSNESIESSTLSQIFRQAEAHASTDSTSSTLSPLTFTAYGEKTTNARDTIYRVDFNSVTNSDAAVGLLAQRRLQATVVKAAAPTIPLSKRFFQSSKDPVDCLQ